jgi:hypothetical protein
MRSMHELTAKAQTRSKNEGPARDGLTMPVYSIARQKGCPHGDNGPPWDILRADFK